MRDDDHVCLCFQVSLHKLRKYLERERPPVASGLSDCLGAGTGCGWCRPFLEQIHRQWREGEDVHLRVSPDSYARRRDVYRGEDGDD